MHDSPDTADTDASATGTPQPRRPRRRGHRGRRVLVIVLISFLVLVGIAVVADSLVAARVEKRISDRIYENSHLAAPPEVVVTGMPYLASLVSHEVPSIHVEARDVDVPDFGRVTMNSSATKIALDREEVLSGNFSDATAREVFTRLQMDTVELGERMGIDDLELRSQDNSSPAGGWETESYLSGTPEGEDGSYEVDTRLRVWEGDVYVTPVSIIDTPDGTDPDDLDDATRDKVMDAFTLELAGDSLPLRSKPRRVYTSGGSLFIEAEQNYTKVSVTDLAPRSEPLREEEQAGL